MRDAEIIENLRDEIWELKRKNQQLQKKLDEIEEIAATAAAL
jgi:hypothetical protein